MKKFFNALTKDTVLTWNFWATIIVVVITIIAIAVSYTNLPPFIPLYNHMPWGYDRLGKTYELFMLPLVIILLCMLNSFLGIRLSEKAPLLARFLFITMTGLALFTLIFIGRLIFTTL